MLPVSLVAVFNSVRNNSAVPTALPIVVLFHTLKKEKKGVGFTNTRVPGMVTNLADGKTMMVVVVTQPMVVQQLYVWSHKKGNNKLK